MKGLELSKWKKIIVYAGSYVLSLPWGAYHTLATVLIAQLVVPDEQIPTGTRTGRTVRWWAMILVFMPLCVFMLCQIVPLPIDDLLHFYVDGTQHNILPSFWLLILYVVSAIALTCGNWPWKWRPSGMILLISGLVAAPYLMQSAISVHQQQTLIESSRSTLAFLAAKSVYYNGLWEELYYRGLLLPILLKWPLGRWKAIAATSAVFAMHHYGLVWRVWLFNDLEAARNLASVFFLGLSCGYIALRSRSLLPAIALHAASSGSDYFVAYFATS